MKTTIKNRLRRKAKRLPTSEQRTLFPRSSLPEEPSSPVPMSVEFHCPSSETIFIGEVPLRRYLSENGMGYVIGLRKELEASDLTAFLAAYRGFRGQYIEIHLFCLVAHGFCGLSRFPGTVYRNSSILPCSPWLLWAQAAIEIRLQLLDKSLVPQRSARLFMAPQFSGRFINKPLSQEGRPIRSQFQ